MRNGKHGRACRHIRAAILFAATLAVTACSIVTTVEPLPEKPISSVCLDKNPDVFMNGFLPALRSEFEKRGIETAVYTEMLPASCNYRVEYTANWKWDMAMYLSYAEIRIFSVARKLEVGSAIYDARMGSMRLDKFGSTESKLAALMRKLFGEAPPEA